jgi:hypothetical protein
MKTKEIQWYEITHHIDGALYDLTSYINNDADGEELAAEWVQQVKSEFKIAAGDDELWELYVHPHHCNRKEIRCNCTQDKNTKAEWSEKASR